MTCTMGTPNSAAILPRTENATKPVNMAEKVSSNGSNTDVLKLDGFM